MSHTPPDAIDLYLRKLTQTSIVMAAKGLSPSQRESLIAHVPGPQPAGTPDKSRRPLLRRELLMFDRPIFGRFTKLTKIGGHVAATLLDAEADTILAARKISAPPVEIMEAAE